MKRRCMGLAVQVPAEVALKRPITQPSGQPDAATLSRGSVSRTDRTHFHIVWASFSARLRAAWIAGRAVFRK